jgi:hypothetical protein
MHRKLVQQHLLVDVQQVVAPVDEGLQRRPTGVGRRPFAQKGCAPLEDGDDLGEAEHADTRCGELDPERQPVHAPRDLGRERELVCIRLEARPRRSRPLEEQLHGGLAKRRNGNARFAGDAQRLAARGEDSQLRTVREERGRDLRRFAEHVLARVEHDECACVAQA